MLITDFATDLLFANIRSSFLCCGVDKNEVTAKIDKKAETIETDKNPSTLRTIESCNCKFWLMSLRWRFKALHHFHLGNEKIDIIFEIVMGLLKKEGKKDEKNILHEAAELCKILNLFVQKTN